MSQEKELVADILKQVEGNMELFYQQKNAEALNAFQQILVKISSMVDTLFAYQRDHADFPLDEGKIKEALTEAMQALENKDLILLADVIQYDFIEYIQELLDKMV